MKANQSEATHYNEIHQEYWLRESGTWYLLNDGHWQKAKPNFNGMVEL